MYHPTIQKLDSAAADFHALGMMVQKNGALRLAGALQQEIYVKSPWNKTGRRFLHAQWAWALGHIGLLYQLIRLFRKREPETQLILETTGAANPHFLMALSPFLTITAKLPDGVREEAMCNAVYFGCPDGTHNLVDFYKLIQRECADIHLLKLSDAEESEVETILSQLGVKRPYVALQARKLDNDPARNVTMEEIEKALEPYKARGYSVVHTGLDPHPVNETYPHIGQDMRKSYLLSAACDQFIGSNSGAWTIANAFQKPVEIMNDWERSAWIYD